MVPPIVRRSKGTGVTKMNLLAILLLLFGSLWIETGVRLGEGANTVPVIDYWEMARRDTWSIGVFRDTDTSPELEYRIHGSLAWGRINCEIRGGLSYPRSPWKYRWLAHLTKITTYPRLRSNPTTIRIRMIDIRAKDRPEEIRTALLVY